MKKNIFITALAICLCFSLMLSGCSGNEYSFSESSMTLSDGTNLPLGSHFEADTSEAYIRTYGSGETSSVSLDSSLNGIKVGSSAKDFIKSFGLEKNYAMWETYIIKSGEETIVNYDNFTGREISYSAYDDRFLTVGYLLDEDGNWTAMHIETLRSIWSLGASADSYGKIAIISAGLDPEGTITTLIADYGEYSNFAAYYLG